MLCWLTLVQEVTPTVGIISRDFWSGRLFTNACSIISQPYRLELSTRSPRPQYSSRSRMAFTVLAFEKSGDVDSSRGTPQDRPLFRLPPSCLTACNFKRLSLGAEWRARKLALRCSRACTAERQLLIVPVKALLQVGGISFPL